MDVGIWGGDHHLYVLKISPNADLAKANDKTTIAFTVRRLARRQSEFVGFLIDGGLRQVGQDLLSCILYCALLIPLTRT